MMSITFSLLWAVLVVHVTIVFVCCRTAIPVVEASLALKVLEFLPIALGATLAAFALPFYLRLLTIRPGHAGTPPKPVARRLRATPRPADEGLPSRETTDLA
jgi:hypothetical protein